MYTIRLRALCLYLIACTTGLSAQTLFADINPGSAGSDPTAIRYLNDDLAFFQAFSPDGQTEIYVSDGSTAGTRVLFDPSGPNVSTEYLNGRRFGDFFYAAVAYGGEVEAWRVNIATGEANMFFAQTDSNPNRRTYGQFTQVGTDVFFIRPATGGFIRYYLNRTDGTAAGTSEVADLSGNLPVGMQEFEGKIYYIGGSAVQNFNGGEEIHVYDPVMNTQTLLFEPPSFNEDRYVYSLKPLADKLVFLIDAEDIGLLVGLIDGQTSTLAIDTVPDTTDRFLFSNIPTRTAILDGFLYFSGNQSGGGEELYKTDGTAAGTSLVANLTSGSADTRIIGLTAANGLLYWYGDRNNGFDDNGFEAWVSDGTAEGTRILRDIAAGFRSNDPPQRTFIAAGGQTFFLAKNLDLGTELWKTDGTEAGTILVKELFPGPLDGANQILAAVGENVIFAGREPDQGFEVFISDGNEATTLLLKDINPAEVGSDPSDFTWHNGDIYCLAFVSDTVGRELVRLSPTGEILEVFNLNGQAASSNIGNLTSYQGRLYFTGRNESRTGLFCINGDEAPLLLTPNLSPNTGDSFTFLDTLNGQIFTDINTSGSREYYLISDGTVEGTRFLRNSNDERLYSAQVGITFQGDYYMRGTFDGTINGLYRYNDLADSAELVTDFYLPDFARYGSPRGLVYNNRLFFGGTDDETFGRYLYQTDGTAAGTYMHTVADPDNTFLPREGRLLVAADDPAEGFYYIANPQQNNGKIYFSQEDTSSIELKFELSRISFPGEGALIAAHGTLYFINEMPAEGRELYRLDESPEGGSLVTEFNVGPEDSEINDLLVLNDTLYFSAFNPGNGFQLYRVGAPDAPAEQLGPIAPAGMDAAVGNIKAIDNTLYFAANDGVSGREVWSFDYVEPSSTDNPAQLAPFASAFEVFPQPAGEQFTVRSIRQDASLSTVELFGLDGRLLQQHTLDRQQQTTISTADLPAGAYVLKVMDANGVFYSRLLTVQ